jgi:vanillate O-demethylase ferredoxin subunit
LADGDTVKTDTLGTLKVRVAARRDEAENIAGFDLVAAGGGSLPAFSAGSHVDVKVAGGLVRQYSLCNDPAECHRYAIAVLKDPATRGGSKAMHERICVGDEIEISTPKNHFPLAYSARRSLLLAGGIGVTPILCMAERLAVTGADFEMHYCTRSPERTAFRERIGSCAFASRVHFHFDDGAPDQKLDIDALLAGKRGKEVHLYVCGPKGFMDAVLNGARAQDWPEQQLHYEFFSAAPAKSDGDSSFEVQLASSGKVIVVAKHQSVVDALAAAGIEIATSCEQGVCGTCITRVLDGVPDHKDVYLTPKEQAANDQFTPCCSRARSSRLVLDI